MKRLRVEVFYATQSLLESMGFAEAFHSLLDGFLDLKSPHGYRLVGTLDLEVGDYSFEALERSAERAFLKFQEPQKPRLRSMMPGDFCVLTPMDPPEKPRLFLCRCIGFRPVDADNFLTELKRDEAA